MSKPKLTFHYPEQMGHIILLAMEEIIGPRGAKAIFTQVPIFSRIDNDPPRNRNLQFSFDVISRLQSALEETYGATAGRGVALRIGRVCFKYGLREFGTQMGLTKMAFRLLPFPARLWEGGKSLAELFNRFTDQRVRIEERGGQILWHIERCPLCWGRQTEYPACYLAVGLLQESLYWLSGGKIFNVEETGCIAHGDPTCTIVIEQDPISW